jgi:very-short-patch-repair endonuclease
MGPQGRVVRRSPAYLALLALGGRASRAELLEHTTRHHLRSALAAGEVHRASRGVYVTRSLPEPKLAAARARGVVSHGTAAQLLGLAMVHPPGEVHVTVAPGAHPPAQPDVVYHRNRLSPECVVAGVTTDLRTVLDCAASLPFAQGLAVADSALRLKRVSRRELLAAAHAQRGPGSRRRRRVAQSADGGADNPFESALRACALTAGFRDVEAQVEIITAAGVYRVDLAQRRLRLALEADSFEWHGDRRALERDCRRYDELQRTGWVVMRFAWEQVMFRQDWVVAVLSDVRRRAEITAGARARNLPQI